MSANNNNNINNNQNTNINNSDGRPDEQHPHQQQEQEHQQQQSANEQPEESSSQQQESTVDQPEQSKDDNEQPKKDPAAVLAFLNATVNKEMEGFHCSHAITHARNYGAFTYQRPTDILRTLADQHLVTDDEEDEFPLEPKAMYPVMGNMKRRVHRRAFEGPSKVPDPEWEAPRPIRQPIPAPTPSIYPESRGFKLRSVEEIMKSLQNGDTQQPTESVHPTTTTSSQSETNNMNLRGDHFNNIVNMVLSNIPKPGCTTMDTTKKTVSTTTSNNNTTTTTAAATITKATNAGQVKSDAFRRQSTTTNRSSAAATNAVDSGRRSSAATTTTSANNRSSADSGRRSSSSNRHAATSSADAGRRPSSRTRDSERRLSASVRPNPSTTDATKSGRRPSASSQQSVHATTAPYPSVSKQANAAAAASNRLQPVNTPTTIVKKARAQRNATTAAKSETKAMSAGTESTPADTKTSSRDATAAATATTVSPVLPPLDDIPDHLEAKDFLTKLDEVEPRSLSTLGRSSTEKPSKKPGVVIQAKDNLQGLIKAPKDLKAAKGKARAKPKVKTKPVVPVPAPVAKPPTYVPYMSTSAYMNPKPCSTKTAADNGPSDDDSSDDSDDETPSVPFPPAVPSSPSSPPPSIPSAPSIRSVSADTTKPSSPSAVAAATPSTPLVSGANTKPVAASAPSPPAIPSDAKASSSAGKPAPASAAVTPAATAKASSGVKPSATSSSTAGKPKTSAARHPERGVKPSSADPSLGSKRASDKRSVVELEEGETVSPSPSPSRLARKSTSSGLGESRTGDRSRSSRAARSSRGSHGSGSPSPHRRSARRHGSRSRSPSSRTRRAPAGRSTSSGRPSSPRRRSRSPLPRSRRSESRRRDRSPEARRHDNSPASRRDDRRRPSSPSLQKGTKRKASSGGRDDPVLSERSAKRQATSSTVSVPVSAPAAPVAPTTQSSSKASPPRASSAKHEPAPGPSVAATPSTNKDQCRIFTIMFKHLAHTYKKRGDAQANPTIGVLDHFHALCNYVLSFYYADKSSSDVVAAKQSIGAWKSLFPFADVLLRKLQERRLDDLWGLCTRLLSLVRFLVHGRMVDAAIPLARKQQRDATSGVPAAMVETLLREYEKAKGLYQDSERFASFAAVSKRFPRTFERTVVGGDFGAGVVLGGEVDSSVLEPGFPLSPLSELNLAALAIKCMLGEWVSSMGVDYAPITNTDEFM
ncbi:MAG: hypothetical protein EXX96DRAFT_560376 [Benjaminiella poitrasii]|nr:MAG: hypothetical protein EXX96DRAFT_560376 [Benjaminiella poitrasii]